MTIKNPIFRVFAGIVVMLALQACDSHDTPDSGEDGASGYPYIDRITVSVASRSAADDGSGGGNSNIDNNLFDIDALLPDNYKVGFDSNTIIQVSQKTVNRIPFDTDDLTYDFCFEEGTGASWDDEASYNFVPYYQDDPLEWNKIGEGGSWNGGFALFCLYFPEENRIRSKEGEAGTKNYYVMQDQRTLENLIKSDILGGYQSTPTLFSRIRFRLFHLMTYVRIRLYVPLYDDVSHTGYREGALNYASLDNVTPDFAIDWNAFRSPDTQGPAVSALDGEGSILMYQHPLKAGKTEHEIVQIKYKDYLTDGYFDQGITGDYDNVRIYDFSVIIPKQRGTKDETGKETSNFTATDFLNFYFTTNSGATTRYYFNQGFSANTNQSTLNMNQGVFQYLELYVPRVGNKLVFVGAKVKNWDQLGTDMVLNPDDPDLK